MTPSIDPLRTGTAALPTAPVARPSPRGSGGDAAVGEASDAQAEAAAAPGDDVDPTAPPRVQSDMVAASRTWESLQASGRELRFEGGGGHVEVTMHDVSGERIAILDLHDVYALIEHERQN